MENRQPLTIAVQPWYEDHGFGGKSVLAAVETMVLLAAQALAWEPDLNVRFMRDARFAKFLEIPPQTASVDALVECESREGGGLRARLLSQVRIGTMRRIKEHGEVVFSPPSESAASNAAFDRLPATVPIKEISVGQIYQELVPFGPSYHSLKETLLVSEHGAWGRLQAPELPFIDPVQEVIGSPFPLDGAMHAACVLGQQFVDYAPFPIGFRQRIVVRPTQPGASYFTRVIPVSQAEDEQVFDLGILDEKGEVFELVRGLQMRDVRRAWR